LNPIPARTLRLFAGYDPVELASPAARAFLIGRLLEDGDREDLLWLARAVGAGAMAAWFARSGGRRLSARSRRFWSVALDLPAGGGSPAAEALWPLA
jgi:hypothetical protein